MEIEFTEELRAIFWSAAAWPAEGDLDVGRGVTAVLKSITVPEPLPVGTKGAFLYVHLPCGGVEWWSPSMTAEYGDINTQGCDACECGADGQWRLVCVMPS